ncbi:MAG TPA: hypothetical protein PLV92_25185, partial [Pirellulaceae bacterium]|nr:hypothetical protein [Pirellulaceae bacterium]
MGYTQVFEKELFRTTLFEFDYEAPHVQPTLAHVEGGTLYLHSGPNAGDREYFNIDDTNETFILSGSGGHVNVEFEDWYLSYDGVTRVVADMGAGDDTFDATRLSGVVVEVDGGDGKDKLYTGSAGGTLRGGPGADQLYGKQGQDTLIGGPGEDRLDSGDGDDRLDGGDDNDNLSGGAGNDTYVFVDGWGVDRFGDTLGDSAFDFSLVHVALEATLSARGLEVFDSSDNRLRASRTLFTSVVLGSGADQIYMKDFPERNVTVNGGGGDDYYRVTLGKAESQKAAGRYNIADKGGSFDNLVVEQTRSGDRVTLDSYSLANGRESLGWSTDIERLTLIGKGAQFDHEEIIDFGGQVAYQPAAGKTSVDLKTTELRVIASELVVSHDLKAKDLILETFKSLNIAHRLNAGFNGYIDARVYNDNTSIRIAADVLGSAGD